jgi:hypothetical protein
MGLGEAKVGLIGHSHAVCLLDALGPWRDQAGIRTSRPDIQNGEAFEGWYDADPERRGFVFRPARSSALTPSGLMTCLITGGMPATLVTPPTNGEEWTELSPTQPFLRYLEQLHDREIVLSVVFGNDVARLQLVDDLAPYDFAERESLSSWSWPDPSYQPIDRVHIQRTIAALSMPLILTVATLQSRLPSARVVHVLPPPPLEHLDRLPPADGPLGALSARYGFARAKLRLKWHFAYCAYAEAALHQRGVQVLGPPDRARTPEGFLREDLGEGHVHANGVYGAMLWDDLNELLN